MACRADRTRYALSCARIPMQYRQGTWAMARHRRVGLSLCDGRGERAQTIRGLQNTHIEALV